MFEKFVVIALVLALFLAVWRVESGWRIVFTPFLLAMYWELTRIFPAFLLADTYAGIESTYALWVAFLAYVSLLAGFVAFYCFPSVQPGRVLALTRRNMPLRLDGLDSAGVVALALALAALGLYFFGGLPATVKSSLSLIAAGGEADLAHLVSEQRLEFTKGAYFGAEYKGQGLVAELQQVGWTLICVYTLLRHLELRRTGSLMLVLAAVAGAWLFVGGFGSRAPLLNIFICMLAAYSLRKPLPLRAMFVAIGIGVAIAIALSLYSNKMYFLLAGALGFGDFVTQALVAIAQRILIGNGLNDVYAIEFVRTGALEVSYGGIHARDLITAIPGVQYGQPLAYKLYLLVNESARGTTFRTGTYLTDVFVDFYWPGVVVIFILIGAALAIAQRWLLRVAADPWSMAVALVIAYAVMNILRAGPVSLGTTMIVITTVWIFHAAVRLVLREIAVASVATGLGTSDRAPDA